MAYLPRLVFYFAFMKESGRGRRSWHKTEGGVFWARKFARIGSPPLYVGPRHH